MATSTTPTLSGTALSSVLELARAQHTDGLSVADLADHAGYSPFHFSRLFSASMHLSPGQFLTALRVDTAKRMLLANTDPVIDVAMGVGFDSLSSFSRRFRATVGVPPASLRTLADRVADAPPRPFRLVDEQAAAVRVTSVLPDDGPSAAALWLGWYRQPAPVGLPAAGVLAEYGEPVRLPLSPGAPWLLGFAVPDASDVASQLIPSKPLVAVHPAPLHAAGEVTLRYRAGTQGVPLLSALPSLCRGR